VNLPDLSRIRRADRLTPFLLSRWRGSLQLRVAVTTFLLSGTIVGILGVALLGQVSHGLLNSTVRSALTEMSAGITPAQNELSAAAASSPASLNEAATKVAGELNSFGATAPSSFGVALLTNSPGLSDDVGENLSTSEIPQRLQTAVAAAGTDREAYTFTQLTDAAGITSPALVVGAPLVAGNSDYQLYYLFPLRQQAETVALVRGTLTFAGIAIVALLVGLTALVTRQVVSPVRMAARIAERFAGGRLEQRMRVRGQDDLARLAQSFNRMAERLQSQIHRLEELSRLQRRFVADVSHELRTPLTTVRMAADVLYADRQSFSGDTGRAAELLQTQLDRFEALLADLLEISRHDAGAAVLDAEPTDIGNLVRRVAEGVEPLARKRGVEVRLRLPNRPLVAEIDNRRVERILRNLIANAIEHSEGQPVTVELAGDAETVAVAVDDQGVGLRPGEGSLVFGRFWRADPSRARATGGSGLGLAIALEDARLHGGWLQAWGEPGAGSRFRLTLPRAAGHTVTSSPLPLGRDEPAPTEEVGAPPPARVPAEPTVVSTSSLRGGRA
jgi:two-component system sensor histidine kinase MtrB